MKYYKIIKDSDFIGIASSENFRKYNEGSGLLLMSNEVDGEFIRLNNKLYRDSWMPILPKKEFNYISARIIEIDENEYNEIASISEEDHEQLEPYIPEEYQPPVYDIPSDESLEATIAYIKREKIKGMSNACYDIITQGFDLIVGNENHHFSLTTQDQLNLMSLSVMAQTQSLIPYHADGEECVFYTAEEINKIVNTANELKIYHTTYYNALKNYINSLDSIEEIAAIQYGVDIPEEYKTSALKILEQ